MPSVVGRVHQKVQGHFKYRLHFVYIALEHKTVANQSHDGSDHKRCACHIKRQLADDLHELGCKTNFLLCFAQRGRHHVFVICIVFAARKCDLT